MVRASPPVAHPSDMTCVTVIVTCRVNISNILKAGHVHNRYTIIRINWWKIDFLWFKYLNMCTYSFLLLTNVFFFSCETRVQLQISSCRSTKWFAYGLPEPKWTNTIPIRLSTAYGLSLWTSTAGVRCRHVRYIMLLTSWYCFTWNWVANFYRLQMLGLVYGAVHVRSTVHSIRHISRSSLFYQLQIDAVIIFIELYIKKKKKT